jgi:HAD superfamily hydrolase (TIGR01484 family)
MTGAGAEHPARAGRARPLVELPARRLADVVGVLTDIDDTLTSAGQITAEALGALGRLRAAGVPTLAVTGRPMGWSEGFARSWPIDAIVAENGAVALFHDADGCFQIEYAQDEATRAANAQRLRRVAARLLREVPGSRLAQDSAGRVTDIAIDHAEFASLSAAQIEQTVQLMRAEGMHATISSIHITGWFGEHDKFSGARWIVRRLLGRDLELEADRWLYVGDSTNDQQMFGRFALSIGVANLLHFADSLTVWPAYLSDGERGQGFAEIARARLAARPG